MAKLILRKPPGQSPPQKADVYKPQVPLVSLASEISVPVSSVEDLTLWLYGIPGIGKTTLSGQFTDAHHLMFEAGANSIPVYQRLVKTWPEMQQYVALMEKQTRFKTATIDCVETAYEMAFKWTCKKLVINHPGEEEDFGKSWARIREEFMEWINRLARVVGVVFVSHAVEREITSAIKDKYTKIVPSLSGKPMEMIAGMVDVIGYYHLDNGQHVLQIRPDDFVLAKTRPPENFLTPKGQEIMKIPMGRNAKEAFANYSAAFRNELEVPEKFLVGYVPEVRTVKKLVARKAPARR